MDEPPASDDPIRTVAPAEPVGEGGAPGPPAPRLRPAFLATLAALLVAVGMQVVMTVVVAIGLMATDAPIEDLPERLQSALQSGPAVIATIALGSGAFGLVAVYAARRAPEGFRDTLGLHPVREPWKAFGLTTIGSIPVLAVSIAAANYVHSRAPLADGFGAFFETVTPLFGVLFVITIAAVPGVCEELLFRGYIQRRLLRRWSPAWSIGWATVLFAVAHVAPSYIAVALPLGVWFGVIAWRTGSVWPSVACHAFVNGGVNAWRLVSKFAGLSEATHWAIDVAFVSVGLVAFALACVWLARYTREPIRDPHQPTEGGAIAVES
ncbi:MAG: CPBP family intramembrane glutamic endopeptidase [Planctomycetota bacterium]